MDLIAFVVEDCHTLLCDDLKKSANSGETPTHTRKDVTFGFLCFAADNLFVNAVGVLALLWLPVFLGIDRGQQISWVWVRGRVRGTPAGGWVDFGQFHGKRQEIRTINFYPTEPQ